MATVVEDPLQAVGALAGMASEQGAAAAIERARELLRQALQRWPATTPAAEACNLLGAFLSTREFDAEAREALDHALALLGRSGQSDDTLRAGIHNNLGQLDARAGALDSATAHLELALGLHRSANGNPTAIAFVTDNLGAVIAAQGDLDRAEALHNEALAALEAQGNRRLADVATTLGNLGRLHARRGEVARARATLLRALDTHLRVGRIEDGDARIPLVQLVDLEIEYGDGDDAAPFADLLLRAGGDEPGVEHHPLAAALLELARSAYRHFRLALAERLLARAIVIFERSVGPAANPTLDAQDLLADVQCARGNHEAGVGSLAALLEHPGGTGQRAARRLTAMGKALRSHGRESFAAAQSMFERAIDQLRRTPPGSEQRRALASALGNLGQLHFEADRLAEAAALYDEALTLLQGLPEDGDLAWLQFNRGLLDYHRAEYAPARARLGEARRLWAKLHGERHPHVGTAADNLALVEWSAGDLAAALGCFAQAAAVHAPVFQRELTVGSERERTLAARANLGDLFRLVSFCFACGTEPEAARLAADMLLQRKGAVLDALAASQQQLRRAAAPAQRRQFDRLLELRRQTAERTLAALVEDRQLPAHELAGAQAEEEELQRALGFAGAIGLAVGAPATAAAVAAALPAGTALIEYLRYSVFDPVRTGSGPPWRGERYAALLMRGATPPAWFDLGEAALIDRQVQTLRDAVAEPDRPWEAAASALRSSVLAPIEGRLGADDTLLIAPDGALALAPFSLIAERWPVQHLNCARELLAPRAAAEPGAPVVVIADPDFDAADPAAGAPARSAQFERLPGTRVEADSVAARFGGALLHLGAAATVQALKAVSRPALLHLGTHGFFEPQPQVRALRHERLLALGDGIMRLQHAVPSVADHPMLHAGLALAGANRCGAAALITAAELALLDLRGTELVLLSACETGLGTFAQGEEFAGLRRSLAIAGAARQFITLWSIDDDAGAAFVAALYRALADGQPGALALRTAQQALRGQPHWAHPFYWAAYAGWGDLAPLSPALRARASRS